MTPASGQRWRLCRDGVVRDVNDPMTAPNHDDARTWPIEGIPDVVAVFAAIRDERAERLARRLKRVERDRDIQKSNAHALARQLAIVADGVPDV